MRITHFLLCFLALIFGTASVADLVGQEAMYILNGSSARTSWVIKSGKGKTTVKEYQLHAPSGPSYLISLDYDIDVRLKGRQTGMVNFLMPEEIFHAQFYSELANNPTMDFLGFKVDFLGMGSAVDHDGNHYDQCFLTHIYDIDLGFGTAADSVDSSFVIRPTDVTGILADFENLEIRLAVHEAVPVLGAVRVDISGKASGFNLKAGFDFTARSMLVRSYPNLP